MILIIGVNGFLGSHLVKSVKSEKIVLLGRGCGKGEVVHPYFQAELNSVGDYKDALKGCNVVIHCAARVHIMNDQSSDPLNDFREVNTAGTMNLARQ